MTRQRALILELFGAARRHFTADEIFTMAKRRMPNISLATVYNNLHALEEQGLIRRISGIDSSDRYDGVCTPHGHLYCTECASVSDFEIPSLDKSLADAVGCDYERYDLTVRYICSNCRSRAYLRVHKP